MPSPAFHATAASTGSRRASARSSEATLASRRPSRYVDGGELLDDLRALVEADLIKPVFDGDLLRYAATDPEAPAV